MKTARLELIAKNLTAPLAFKSPGDMTGEHYISQQKGLINILEKNGRMREEPFLDIRSKLMPLDPIYEERGLLGFAFHPDFLNNRKFYVYYTAPLRKGAEQNFCCTNYLSEFSAGERTADAGSEKILMHVDKPQANHNGGDICFGPDGYLYLSIGDGGGANDTANGHTAVKGNGQDVTKLLGKILRIDVDSGEPYSIPPDNPFSFDNSGARKEIWAYGFRNPWRMSFDKETGKLYAGDVGQELWEEIDIVAGGGNYGWNIKEAAHYFDPENPDMSLPLARMIPENYGQLIDPVIEAPNSRNRENWGLAIIGGYVYRGKSLPGFYGNYIFGFWSRSMRHPEGIIAASETVGNKAGLWDFEKIYIENTDNDGNLDGYLLSFAEDEDRELYLLTHGTSGPAGFSGKIWKLVP